MHLERTLVCLVTTALFLSCTNQMSEEQLVAKAREIHERVLTIDTHDDIPFNFATPEVDPGVRGDRQENKKWSLQSIIIAG